MKFKKLGDTNLDVSLICLGTMTWGEQNTQEEGFEQMDYAIEKGINFLHSILSMTCCSLISGSFHGFRPNESLP